MNDPYNLQRFVLAQESIYSQVVEELRLGQKRGHWMWFIFPQIQGLGSSWMSHEYAIRSKEEAVAYLAHPTLGPRLRECVELVVSIEDRSLKSILGYPDDLKFQSSMTLFSAASPDEALFRFALDKYCGGEPDPLTLNQI